MLILLTVAIALLVVAFVGFGISAFYPAPEFPEPPAQLEFVDPNQTDEETKNSSLSRGRRKRPTRSGSLTILSGGLFHRHRRSGSASCRQHPLAQRLGCLIGDGVSLGRCLPCFTD